MSSSSAPQLVRGLETGGVLGGLLHPVVGCSSFGVAPALLRFLHRRPPHVEQQRADAALGSAQLALDLSRLGREVYQSDRIEGMAHRVTVQQLGVGVER